MHHSGNQLVDPHLLFERAHVLPGMHAADLGCGRTGHLVFPMARTVGEKGVVYAVDIQKDILELIRKRAEGSGLMNVHTIWSDIERIGETAIPSASLDVAFLVDTLFMATDRVAMLGEAKRLLKDKARLVVVDWSEKGLPFAPTEENMVNFDEIRAWAGNHGFVVQEEFFVGPMQRGMVLYKHE